jgi:sulfatase maturation enzyme AslB (radical SAM superfamily)
MILRDHPWQYNHMISLCSNGVLYFDPKVQAYMKKHFNRLSFNISIDGNKQLHDSCRIFPDGRGSYDIAMAGVKHWT